MEAIRLILIGIVIGMANVIPGVSGGTLAVVFNIFDKFVNAISLNLKKLKSNWKFVVPLLCGMATGVLLFSKMIQFLYEKFPVQTNYVFTGLIIGSIPMIFNYMMQKPKENNSSKVKTFVICFFGIVVGILLIIGFNILQKEYAGLKEISLVFELPVWTIELAVRIFIAGILGAVAMIIPGISGSLIMLIMGVYPIIICAIPALFNTSTFFHALILLLPNGIGVLTGLLLGAKLISWLLKKFQTATYAVILGLLVGSAIVLCPYFKGIDSVLKAIACFICFCAGILMSYISSKVTGEEK